MGIEVALKAWLSGGALKVNKKTWFSHWFRGGGGPGFPYSLGGREVDKARKYSKDLWLNDKWPLQTRKFAWILEKFNPPGWNRNAKKTIIYLTDNTLDPVLAIKCREKLLEVAGDNPIISVSQVPIELGTNICVGQIGRSWMSLLKQLMAGLEAAETKYIAIAEHDCLYTPEHFNWIPPRDDVFYYNKNHWLVEWDSNHPELRGMYSRRWNRHNALSQLVCSRELLIACEKEKLTLIEMGKDKTSKAILRSGEPGTINERIVEAARKATNGTCDYLFPYLEAYVKKYRHEFFETVNPNLDIRHKTNFTGPKRGKQRTYSIPYWGEFKSLWEAESK